MIGRLRKKFIAICMASVFLVMAVVVLLINGVNARRSDGMIDSMLAAIAHNKGRFPRAEESDRRPPRERWPFASAEAPFTTRHFSVLLSDDGEALETNTESIAAVTGDEAVEYARELLEKGRASGWKGVYRYLKTDAEGGVLFTFLDSSEALGSRQQLLLISSTVALLSCGAVFVLVLLLSGRAIRPIAESVRRQRQFITDAGHELKTPLTIISANCEILAINQGDSEWLESVRGQTDRMRKLVNNLVALSRMDEEQPRIERTRFSISDAVYDTAAAFSSAAEREGKRLVLNVAPDCEYVGDEAAIRQLASILVDNAVKYADEGGEIAVELSPGKSPVLSVENSFKAVATLKLDRLFDRFYRGDPARTGSGSFGLGLSIARSIIEAHRGSIRAEMAGPGRIRVRARL